MLILQHPFSKQHHRDAIHVKVIISLFKPNSDEYFAFLFQLVSVGFNLMTSFYKILTILTNYLSTTSFYKIIKKIDFMNFNQLPYPFVLGLKDGVIIHNFIYVHYIHTYIVAEHDKKKKFSLNLFLQYKITS